MRITERLALFTIGVAVVVLAIKVLAYAVTGSSAFYSDAAESVVNLATAVAAFIAIRVAGRPADSNHPYGHYKAEYLSAVFEGALIVVAAIAIFQEAYHGILVPRAIDAPLAGMAVSAVATVINGIWGVVLVRHGRGQRSPALSADGWHLLTDVLSSVGVVVGVGLAVWTGWAILDPIVAALVGANVLWSGWSLTRGSIGGLMDEAVPHDVLDRIRARIRENAEGAIEAHDLRTRRAGRATFLDFHLVVPGTMSVSEAHAICDRIELALRAEAPQTIISIHVEPDDKAKHRGIIIV